VISLESTGLGPSAPAWSKWLPSHKSLNAARRFRDEKRLQFLDGELAKALPHTAQEKDAPGV
jgi:hypothetical protein